MPLELFRNPAKNLLPAKTKVKYEFHIAKDIRKKYDIDDAFFSITGNVVLTDFPAVRKFVQKLNAKRKAPDKVSPGYVNAMGLLDEIYHFILREYETTVNPGVFKKALDGLNTGLGEEEVDKLLLEFVTLFPPAEVYKEKINAWNYLNSYTDDRANRLIVLEELLLLYFANYNPANKKLKELFDENLFQNKKLFYSIIINLDKFFETEHPFGPDNQDIFKMLKSPIDINPDNLEAQLEFIIQKWEIIIKDKFSRRILSSKDLMREDVTFEGFGGAGGGAPTIAPQYKGGMPDADFLRIGKSGYQYAMDVDDFYEEPENFTPDVEWMPNVVLLAKNAFVWLDQLSKKYQREIKTLDQVPDEELDQICKWNFKGLWLIGIWERSPASKRIKHIMGNIDAVASAYSLYDYQIADDLGGEKAYEDLNKRAKQRGIRLASDMVPNHTGIVSDWVKNHPEYFIQSDFPPFPNYTFHGPNLSDDPEYQVRIEDGYYERRDAAVVFQRINNKTGEVKYMYHGNDGTSMPWNDTAQLNLMKPEVREAVIQKIFDVARRFSIIRFDAAMTLTKKHYQRLWFPQPGTGGDIPSRADYAMTRSEFDEQFPQEFWREVVDRFNKELPETLLLAEAFWLMEGYFVRSLGMHRVYNSAFMHMMMKEENEKYRDLITNTLEFEPEILKRYVNFMSNPDEETAIRQFGADDKYFGVLTLMITLPGLPMFAHGQIEGFTEKYGMEYKRAYYNESPNEWLIEKHQKEIFSLMKKRYVFSEVNNFWLFDLHKDYGEGINENVYAYTNSAFGEKTLVLFNNKFEEAYGTLYESAPKLVNGGGGKYAETKKIHEALEIKPEENYYYIYSDHNEKMEYIISGQDIVFNGWRVELGAFKYKVYMNFREVYDSTGEYAKLKQRLGNSGTPNVKRKLEEIRLEPVHNAFKGIFLKEPIREFIKNYVLFNREAKKEKLVPKAFGRMMEVTKDLLKLKKDKTAICNSFNETIEHVEGLNKMLIQELSSKKNIRYSNFEYTYMLSLQSNYNEMTQIYLLYLVIASLKELFPKEGEINQSNYKEKLMLDVPVRDVLTHLGRGEYLIFVGLTLLNIFFECKTSLFDVKDREEEFETSLENIELKDYVKVKKAKEFTSLMKDELVKTFLGVNCHEGVWYYSKERFEDLINWLATLELIKSVSKGLMLPEVEVEIKNIFHLADYFKETSLKSGYKLEVLQEIIITGEINDTEETTEKSV